MQEKKQIVFKTPDISLMQEVVINQKTKIYIALGADPEEARIRYWDRINAKGKVINTPKRTVIS